MLNMEIRMKLTDHNCPQGEFPLYLCKIDIPLNNQNWAETRTTRQPTNQPTDQPTKPTNWQPMTTYHQPATQSTNHKTQTSLPLLRPPLDVPSL
jgi:hypothetical protein